MTDIIMFNHGSRVFLLSALEINYIDHSRMEAFVYYATNTLLSIVALLLYHQSFILHSCQCQQTLNTVV